MKGGGGSYSNSAQVPHWAFRCLARRETFTRFFIIKKKKSFIAHVRVVGHRLSYIHLAPPDAFHVISVSSLPRYCCSSASMYNTEHKWNNKHSRHGNEASPRRAQVWLCYCISWYNSHVRMSALGQQQDFWFLGPATAKDLPWVSPGQL